MKLMPHEILNYLGFEVREEGVEVNENDAFFISAALKLTGGTINIEDIPSEDLKDLHTGLVGLVAAWNQKDASEWNETSEAKLRAHIRAMMKTHFGLNQTLK
jgi:hypothetical protein